jgi:hypothetical protein
MDIFRKQVPLHEKVGRNSQQGDPRKGKDNDDIQEQHIEVKLAQGRSNPLKMRHGFINQHRDHDKVNKVEHNRNPAYQDIAFPEKLGRHLKTGNCTGQDAEIFTVEKPDPDKEHGNDKKYSQEPVEVADVSFPG